MLRFIRTERGAWMPCESFPVRAVADENGALLYRADGTSFRGRIVDKWVTGAAEAWEPHFGRCANPVFAGSGGRKPREDPAVTERRRREARRRAEEEYKRVLARQLAALPLRFCRGGKSCAGRRQASFFGEHPLTLGCSPSQGKRNKRCTNRADMEVARTT